MRPEKERLFDEFVTTRYHALRRTAYLPCGDWRQQETGGALPAWTDCVRGTLPDGSRTVTGSRTLDDGDTTVEVLILMPDGTARALMSGTRNSRTGALLGGPPLTGPELFTLAAQPDIFSTIARGPSGPR
ncbi:hypothetical protein ACIBSV_02205 [Embleya sp. NPDC050154]|uniref:hypothetical protein n=1 Tax=unclassified Embleya TaxID=2699296 RepID=UPI0037A081BE